MRGDVTACITSRKEPIYRRENVIEVKADFGEQVGGMEGKRVSEPDSQVPETPELLFRTTASL
jgi:hypothetical protein